MEEEEEEEEEDEEEEEEEDEDEEQEDDFQEGQAMQVLVRSVSVFKGKVQHW